MHAPHMPRPRDTCLKSVPFPGPFYLYHVTYKVEEAIAQPNQVAFSTTESERFLRNRRKVIFGPPRLERLKLKRAECKGYVNARSRCNGVPVRVEGENGSANMSEFKSPTEISNEKGFEIYIGQSTLSHAAPKYLAKPSHSRIPVLGHEDARVLVKDLPH